MPDLMAHNEPDNGQRHIQISWPDLKYTSPISDTLRCTICNNLYYNAVITKACGHTFCSSCLETHLSITQVQPKEQEQDSWALCRVCSKRLYFNRRVAVSLVEQVSYYDLPLNEVLSEKNVKCPNNIRDGTCGWEGPRSLVEHHVRDICDYTLIRCVDKNCPKETSRGSAVLRRGCLHYKSGCLFCSQLIDTERLHEHLQTCGACIVLCKMCDDQVQRRLMPTHRCHGRLANRRRDRPANRRRDLAFRGPEIHMVGHMQSYIYGKMAQSKRKTERIAQNLHHIKKDMATLEADLEADLESEKRQGAYKIKKEPQ